MNLYAYVGNDPLNATDPSGLAKVCTSKESCVFVDGDGDGDGDSKDNDLKSSQISAFAEHFSKFINKNNNADLKDFGKKVTGNASDDDKSTVRVASQFVGSALFAEARRTRLTQNYVAWQRVSSIQARGGIFARFAKDPAGVDRRTGEVLITGRKMGGQNLYEHPSGLARALIHESLHLDNWYQNNGHRQLDAAARRILINIGLGEGGCPGGFGFPSC